MKHKFVNFANAISDVGEKLVLQFIGFAQSNSKLKFLTKYSDPLWIYSYFTRNLYVGGWIWKPNINRAQLLDLHSSSYHVTLHTHNQHLISLYSNIWNSYKISHFSSQNIVTFNVIWHQLFHYFNYFTVWFTPSLDHPLNYQLTLWYQHPVNIFVPWLSSFMVRNYF